MKKLAATLLTACLLCGGLMTGALADTWEPDEFNAWMTDNVGSIDENTTPEELDEIIDKLSNTEIALPEEGDGLTGSMTAGSYGGSINQLFAELQKKMAEEAKGTAMDRIEEIRAQQEEQSRASGYISDLRGLRLKLADDEMTCAMPDEIVAYMQEKSIALPEDPSAVNRERWRTPSSVWSPTLNTWAQTSTTARRTSRTTWACTTAIPAVPPRPSTPQTRP